MAYPTLPRFALAFYLAAAAPAAATSYTAALDTLGPQLHILLTVRDALTSATALNATVQPSELLTSQGTSANQGVLDPHWFLSTLAFDWKPLTFTGTVGPAEIPFTLNLDLVQTLLKATGASTSLTPDGLALLPGGVQRTTDLSYAGVQGRVLGSLTGAGTPFGFDTGLNLLCDRCVSGVLAATPNALSIGEFTVASLEGEPFLHREFSAGGLTWALNVIGTVGGAHMTAVPEPGTALLLGAGVVGLTMIGRARLRR